MEFSHQWDQLLTRRHFFGRTAWGIGTCAFSSLLRQSASAASRDRETGGPYFAPKAKRVIYIFQTGGPSPFETFDYKPLLADMDGQPVPKSVVGDQRLPVSPDKQLTIVASPYRFAQYGEGGAWISELFPHMGAVADDLCFINSMNTESINHDPGVTYMMTGLQHPGRPSMGAWASYGLGTENADLPAFVVLLQTSKSFDAGTPVGANQWGSGFLSSRHQGVKMRTAADPVLYLNNPPGIDSEARRWMLDTGAALNRIQLQAFGDPEISTRIAQYELAYRMQTSVPKLMDFSEEPDHVFDLYGPESRIPGTYAANCLLARRLAETGARFVQLFDRDWDHHSNLKTLLSRKANEIDRPTAALIRDLKQHGLLDDTLVICSGEFGRSVYSQGLEKSTGNYGRDHHGRCFTAWMAGAGVRTGQSVGKSDDFSFSVAEDPVHVHDFNATILHLLGIDHTALTFRHQGRDHRLTDVHGTVIRKILA